MEKFVEKITRHKEIVDRNSLKNLSTVDREWTLILAFCRDVLRSPVSDSSRAMKFARVLPMIFRAVTAIFVSFLFLSPFYLLSSGLVVYASRFVLPSFSRDESGWDIALISSFSLFFVGLRENAARVTFAFPFLSLPCFLSRKEKCVLSTATRISEQDLVRKPVCHRRCVRFTDRNNETLYLSLAIFPTSRTKKKVYQKISFCSFPSILRFWQVLRSIII